MLILHRITPFFIGLTGALGFFALSRLPSLMFVIAGAMLVVFLLLFARLVRVRPRAFQFWYFVGTPIIFFSSAFGVWLFLETDIERTAISLVVSLSLFLFAEHLFRYVHLPVEYQAYAIEHVSLILHVLTVFFLGSVGFGLLMFLQAPLIILTTVFFFLMLFMVYGVLWASKASSQQARIYGFAGALLATELFAVLSFLPTGFFTNAAALAVFVYLFLGLARAHFLDKLSRVVLRRYIAIGMVLMGFIAGTTQWI